MKFVLSSSDHNMKTNWKTVVKIRSSIRLRLLLYIKLNSTSKSNESGKFNQATFEFGYDQIDDILPLFSYVWTFQTYKNRT